MKNILNKALEHAKLEYPKESCGLVCGNTYVPCTNISKTPTKTFTISPSDYARAEDIYENIDYIVHSHPNRNPAPSQADLVGIERTNMPWIIVNPSTGAHTITTPSGYEAPYIGREFSHGILDCYSLIRDYYFREFEIILPDYDREDKWWEAGEDLYRTYFSHAGFSIVEDKLKEGDVILMMLGSSTPNHGAIYIGDGKILHHIQGRLSSTDIYGGFWQKITYCKLRHKDL